MWKYLSYIKNNVKIELFIPDSKSILRFRVWVQIGSRRRKFCHIRIQTADHGLHTCLVCLILQWRRYIRFRPVDWPRRILWIRRTGDQEYRILRCFVPYRRHSCRRQGSCWHSRRWCFRPRCLVQAECVRRFPGCRLRPTWSSRYSRWHIRLHWNRLVHCRSCFQSGTDIHPQRYSGFRLLFRTHGKR